jgi:hypothetical protein
VPVVGALAASAGRPWDPLLTFPLWAVLTGAIFFGMGGDHWGRFYLLGLAFFAASAPMALRPEWSPPAFGLLASLVFVAIGLQLRRTSAEDPGPEPGPP